MNVRTRWMAAAAVGIALAVTLRLAAAQGTAIKLATMVPEGSVWHKVLLTLGDDWSKSTQGRTTLRIYPGGVAGDEPDMVRKMRIGQIQAGALTVVGLSSIDDAFMVFEIPMLFDSYDELLHVLGRMEPMLKKRLEAKGFVLLNWGHAGWLYFFSKQPIRNVADLKKAKLFVPAGDDRMVQMWKDGGFQPVPLAMTDIMTGLQTGMIDALPLTPLGVLMLQWFRSTGYMANVPLMPLVGGLIVTKSAWNKIPEADRAGLMAACRKAERTLATQIPSQDRAATAEMEKRGLKPVAPERPAEWRQLSDQFIARMRGSIVPAEVLDLALRERDAYRARGKAPR